MLSSKLVVSSRGAPEDVVADLKRLGFTYYEARIYVQLLRQADPGTAYELSKNAGVPRPNTYNALETLAQRGAVLLVSETPARYVAAPPKELLGDIARRTSRLCSDVGTRLAELSAPVEDQHVWIHSGSAAVHSKIERLIETSREMLMIKASDDILRRHKTSLAVAAERGVAMLIVVFGSDTEEFAFGPRCRTYIHEGNGVRMGSTDNLFTIAADRSEMITAIAADHFEMSTTRMSEEIVAVHTRNQPIVNLAESLIRHDYYMAEIFLRFGRELEAAFGPYLQDLRLRCFTPEQAESFRMKTGL